MAFVKTIFTCPVCNDKTGIHCVKPKHFTPSRMNFDCSNCDSKFKLVVALVRGEPGKCSIKGDIVEIGEAGQKILDEREAKKAKQA